MKLFPEPTPEEMAAMERDAEYLEAFGEFSDKVVTGQRPDIDLFLAAHPQFADRLRPELEFAQCFQDEVERFKRDFPDIDPLDLLFPDPDSEARKLILDIRQRRSR